MSLDMVYRLPEDGGVLLKRGGKQRTVLLCILVVCMLVLYMNNSNHIYFFFMESYCLFFKQSKLQTPQTRSAHCCITLCYSMLYTW